MKRIHWEICIGHRLTRWTTLGFALAAVGLLLTTGCPKRGSASSGTGDSANVLRYALQTKPTTLDPALVEDGDTIDMLMQVFEGLVQWDDNNKIVPNIAESWDISKDGTIYTFHLKDNVTFHNGRKLTADDFVYTLTRVLMKGTNSSTAMTYLNDIVGAADLHDGKTDKLVGVKAVDAKTLEITIDKPRPYFLSKLTYPTAYVVCKEVLDANGGQFSDKTMIGTGPFKLREYKSGYNVSLVANAEYHGGKPLIAGIERPIQIDSLGRQNKYESNGVDLTDVQRSDLPRLKQDPKLQPELKEFPRANIYYLAMNQKAFAPFKDKRVRQAFAMAINKKDLIKIALNGTAKEATGVVPPGVLGYDESFQGLPYDPEKAKQLMAEAGYPGGQNFPTFQLTFRDGYQYIKDGAELIKSDLEKNLGIKVELGMIEWAKFLDERQKGTMPCYHLRWSADYLDPQNFLSLMLRTGAPENTLGYSNPEFDKLCDQADVETNPEKRIALYRQAERLVVDDAPWVCLYHLNDVELHKPYLKGVREGLLGHLPHTKVTLTN